jgi:L-fucose isomerase-like protein
MTLKKLTPRIGVAGLSSPLEIGADRAPAVAKAVASRLSEAGCETTLLGPVDTPPRASEAGRALAEDHVDAVMLVPTCWCEDYLVLDLIEEWPCPVVFWPQPGMETGALCGTQQTTAYLRQLGHPYKSVFGETTDEKCLSKATFFLRAAALKARLRRAKIGMAGNRVNGMTHTAPNEFVLKKVIGPRVVFLDVPDLLMRGEQVPETDADAVWKKIAAAAGSCKVTEDEGLDSARIYIAVREQAQKYGLQALTVGCYPQLMGRVCLAASLLADEGLPVACEGDVHGAVGQYILQLLTGQPTHSTDWLDPLEDGSVVFTHCGSGSFSLAERKEEICLDSVRLMGQGVCALFTAKPGPVTLVGLLASGNRYQCAVVEGEAAHTEMVFPGNPVRVKFAGPVDSLIQWIHDEGVGHHWMIGCGHVAEEIRQWAGIVGDGLKLVEPW